MDLIPDAGTGLIHITPLCCGTAAGPVTHSLGTLHGADKGSLLQQAISTHPATKHGPFDPAFNFPEYPFPKRFFLEWEKGRLPSSPWSK